MQLEPNYLTFDDHEVVGRHRRGRPPSEGCAERSMCGHAYINSCVSYMLGLLLRVFYEAKALGLAFHNMLTNSSSFLNSSRSCDGASKPGRRCTPSSLLVA